MVVVIENVFCYPGLGSRLIDAVKLKNHLCYRRIFYMPFLILTSAFRVYPKVLVHKEVTNVSLLRV